MAPGTRKPLASRVKKIFRLCLTRPSEIIVNFVFRHIHAASIYTICLPTLDTILVFRSGKPHSFALFITKVSLFGNHFSYSFLYSF